MNLFKFQQGPEIPVPPIVWIGLAVCAVAGFLGYLYLRRAKQKKVHAQIQKVSEEKANLRLDMLLSKLHMKEKSRGLLENISGSTNPREILPMVESVEEFERRIQTYKQQHKDIKLYKQICKLRRDLGFEFTNRRVSFVATQMLSSGLKLECKVPHPEKRIAFMSPILDVGETRLLIKPPTVKGKPVNLKRFQKLVCRIRRDDDAEYEFTLPIVNQISGKLNAIVMGHTSAIDKMFIRESERVPMDIPATFYLVSEEDLEKSGEENLENSDHSLPVEAHIVDMSVGGLKIVASQVPDHLDEGGMLVFHLEGAHLRESMIAQVVGIVYHGSSCDVHLQFIRMRDLTRMKVNKFLHRMKTRGHAKSSTPASGEEPPQKKSSATEDVPQSTPKASQGEKAQDRKVSSLKKAERDALLK